MNTLRRAFRLACLLVLHSILLSPLASHAQDRWPSRPIVFIVPFPAGSNPDVFTRLITSELSKRINTPVVIENVVGAGGVIGTDRLVRSKPDGYTFGLGVESTVLLAQLVKPATVKYDGLVDLTPVVLMGTQPLVLIAKPELQVSTMQQLLAYGRTHPNDLSYGTSGIGTSLHIAGELLGIEGRVELTHVPYSNSPQIMTDVASNQLPLAMVPVGSAIQFINGGRFKALGVTSDQRSPHLPNVPAMAELAELKGVNLVVWHAFFAPAGLDKSVNERMQSEIAAILAMPAVNQRITEMGFQISVAHGEPFTRLLLAERSKYRALVTQKNIKAE